MSDQQDEIIRDTESLLASFAPRAPRIDRDRLMYLAGVASGRHQTPAGLRAPRSAAPARAWFWPASTFTMTATSAALLVALLLRSEPAERTVVHELPAAPSAPAVQQSPVIDQQRPPAPLVAIAEQPTARPRVSEAPAEEANYLRNRELALAQGIDALAPVAQHGSGGTKPSSYRDLIQQLNPRPRTSVAAYPIFTWPRLLFDDLSM